MRRWVLALGLLLALCGTAQAEEDFYRGKNLNLYIGYGPGAFDDYGRLLARHLADHIPGKPTMVVRTMAGAATLTLTNFLYNQAPRDGTVIASVHERIGVEPLYDKSNARYDPLQFNWLGSIHSNTMVCAAWHEAKAKTLQDAMVTEILMGASGVSGDSIVGPRVLNGLIGTQMKIITGYSAAEGAGQFLAMERGEIEGRCIGWAALKSWKPDWLAEKKINLLVQMAVAKNPELPDVPLVMDYAKGEGDRQALRLLFGTQAMGRPYVAPPGIPPERVAILRKAFDDTMGDAKFRADAAQGNFTIDPMPGEEMQRRLAELLATPPEIVARVDALQKGGAAK